MQDMNRFINFFLQNKNVCDLMRSFIDSKAAGVVCYSLDL